MIDIRGWLAVVRKELTIYFSTRFFYITGFFSPAPGGIFFSTPTSSITASSASRRPSRRPTPGGAQLNPLQMVWRPLFAVLGIILLFLVPFITMRLMAEEKRSGTAELLFTYPLTDWP